MTRQKISFGQRYLAWIYVAAIILALVALTPPYLRNEVEKSIRPSVSVPRTAVSFARQDPKLTLDIQNLSMFDLKIESATLSGMVIGVALRSGCAEWAQLNTLVPSHKTTPVDFPLCFDSDGPRQAIESMNPDSPPSRITTDIHVTLMGFEARKHFSAYLPDDLVREGLRAVITTREDAGKHPGRVRRHRPDKTVRSHGDDGDPLAATFQGLMNALQAVSREPQ